MKNITFSADEHLIEQAREAAAARHTTLNVAFREWLDQYVSRKSYAQQFDELMESTRYLGVDRKYTREEMNER